MYTFATLQVFQAGIPDAQLSYGSTPQAALAIGLQLGLRQGPLRDGLDRQQDAGKGEAGQQAGSAVHGLDCRLHASAVAGKPRPLYAHP